MMVQFDQACPKVFMWHSKHGLLFTPNAFVLEAYIDADGAGNIDDRRSTGRFTIFLGQNLVAWSAKKQ